MAISDQDEAALNVVSAQLALARVTLETSQRFVEVQGAEIETLRAGKAELVEALERAQHQLWDGTDVMAIVTALIDKHKGDTP